MDGQLGPDLQEMSTHPSILHHPSIMYTKRQSGLGHLQDGQLGPDLRAHVAEDLEAERAVHVAQEAQLVVEGGRLPPAEREEAAHLPARDEY